MDLLTVVLAASVSVELVAGLVFTVTFARKPSEREFVFAGALCFAAALHAAGEALGLVSGAAQASIVDDRVAWLGLIAFQPLALHYSASARARRPSARLLAASYGLAVVFAGLDLAGLLHDPRGGAASSEALLLGSIDSLHHATPLGPFGVAAYVGVVGAAGSVLLGVARAYLGGRREALTVVVGATVLLATSLNDLAAATGTLATGYLVDAGFVAFVVAMSTTPSARYATTARELERRTKELRARGRELRRSHEVLRAAQEELVKKEQLAVVGELAAVIAHEVRNPLAIIGNAVAGLRKPVISREDHVTLLTILDEEAVRLNRLVSDLLAYARPVSVQRQQLSVADLVERALGLVDAAGRSIRVELKVECSEGRVFGDANLLRQVFDNLVDNAAQAMGTGGTLTVRLRAATEDGVDGIAVDIVDTGEGMDTQVRSRARDPFFTTRPSGTGLGLAIVDRIVDAHGGHFTIDSRAGEGTTVTVFLPHGSASEPPAPRGRLVSRTGTDPPTSQT